MTKLAIWDIDFLPYYVCYNKPGEQKTIEDCKRLTDSFITTVNNTIGSSAFLGCLTVGKCFRYKIYPEYKHNRKYNYDPEYAAKMAAIKEYLIIEYSCVYKLDEYEADDLVVMYKNILSDEFDCVIVSPDKDILNLEGKHYNPKQHTWVITSKEQAEKYFWTSMLVGDVIDNIKGCKGIGMKTAEIILNNVPVKQYRNVVMDNYCEVFGEKLGISEFYKNYKCLSMETHDPNLLRPQLLELVSKE